MGEPIVELVTGQSNASNKVAYSWTPPANLLVWNWDGNIGTVGNDFVAPDPTKMCLGYSAAATEARANPDRMVYLINIAYPGQAIASWLPGASLDVYATLKANTEAALAKIGRTKVDKAGWWQGEGDAASTTYESDFEAVHARLRGETWFPYTTHIVMMGISPYVATWDIFNINLLNLAARDPDCRSYVRTGMLPTSAGIFWDPAAPFTYVHMLGAGYEQAGAMMGQRWLGGPKYGSQRIARFKANKNDQLSLSAGAVLMHWENLVWSENGAFVFDSWTPPPGYVSIDAAVFIDSIQTAKAMVYKNGALFQNGPLLTPLGALGGNFCPVHAEDLANGTDYYQIYMQITTSSTANVLGSNTNTFFSGICYP